MTTTETTRRCQWGTCDAEATLSLPGYDGESRTQRGTEWYCEECYEQRVAELTERATCYSTEERDEQVALDVHLDRLGLDARAELEYGDEGYTGRATISSTDRLSRGPGVVTMTTGRAIRTLADLDCDASSEDAWAALSKAEASAAEQLAGYEMVGEAELDTYRDPTPERIIAGPIGAPDRPRWEKAAEELFAEARRVGGCVRWHRPSKRPVVAVKVGRPGTEQRWMARLR